VTTSDARVTTSDARVTTSDARVTTSDARVTTSDARVTTRLEIFSILEKNKIFSSKFNLGVILSV